MARAENDESTAELAANATLFAAIAILQAAVGALVSAMLETELPGVLAVDPLQTLWGLLPYVVFLAALAVASGGAGKLGLFGFGFGAAGGQVLLGDPLNPTGPGLVLVGGVLSWLALYFDPS